MKEITKKEIEENSLDILHFLDLGIKKYNTPLSKQLEKLGYISLSTGDMLREKAKTDLVLDEMMKKGTLI